MSCLSRLLSVALLPLPETKLLRSTTSCFQSCRVSCLRRSQLHRTDLLDQAFDALPTTRGCKTCSALQVKGEGVIALPFLSLEWEMVMHAISSRLAFPLSKRQSFDERTVLSRCSALLLFFLLCSEGASLQQGRRRIDSLITGQVTQGSDEKRADRPVVVTTTFPPLVSGYAAVVVASYPTSAPLVPWFPRL